MVSSWALNGLILSVGASLLLAVFGQANHAVVGSVIGLSTISASAASVLDRNLSPTAMARLGSTVIALGAVLFVLALSLRLGSRCSSQRRSSRGRVSEPGTWGRYAR
jgi:hypothetical protein